MTLSFTTTITQSMGLQETYGITNYLNFMFNLVLPLALLFELPLVVMFLTKIRILNPRGFENAQTRVFRARIHRGCHYAAGLHIGFPGHDSTAAVRIQRVSVLRDLPQAVRGGYGTGQPVHTGR